MREDTALLGGAKSSSTQGGAMWEMVGLGLGLGQLRREEVQVRVLGVCVRLFQVRINPHFALATLMVPPHHRSSSGCNFPPTVPYLSKQ